MNQSDALENSKFKCLIFSYDEERWGSVEKIKRIYQKKKYDSQDKKLNCSISAKPLNGDTLVCLSKQTNKISFLCKIRSPSIENNAFDYTKLFFLDNPVDLEEISNLKLYQLFPSPDGKSNTLWVVFNMSFNIPVFREIKQLLITNNPRQSADIETYLNCSTINSQCNKSYNPVKNIILYGPPGTGKTYKTKKIAVDLIENRESISISHSTKNYSNEEITAHILEKIQLNKLNLEDAPLIRKDYIQFRFWNHKHSPSQGCHFEFWPREPYSFGFDCEYPKMDVHYSSLIKLKKYITSKMEIINKRRPDIRISDTQKIWFRLKTTKKYDLLDEAITNFVEFIQFILPLLNQSGIMEEFNK